MKRLTLIVGTLLSVVCSSSFGFGAMGGGGTISGGTVPGNVVTNVSDAQMAAQELANAGQLGNLADFVSFCSGEMTNSYRGAPVYRTGRADSQQLLGNGASFQNYGSLMIPVNVAPSNTVVIIWKPGITNQPANNGQTVLMQLINTNNGDSEYVNYSVGLMGSGGQGWCNFNMSALNVPGVVSLGTGNLMEYNNPMQGMIYQWQHVRHITAISHDGAGNVTIYDNGQVGNWYVNSTPTLAFAHYPTTTMNALSIGGIYLTNGVASMYTNGYYGNVESVFLFNSAANTNIIQATLYASDWIQPFTTKDWWAGDSLMQQSGFNTTNTCADDCEAWQHNSIYYDFTQGGTQLYQYALITNWMLLQEPHGKITKQCWYIGGGINDVYSAGLNGAQMFTRLTNAIIPMLLLDPRYEADVFNVFQTGTNAQAGNYPQTAAGLTAIQTYNQCVATNRNLITHVYDRYAFCPQSFLTTNAVPRYSTLGLHFDDPTNGLAAYRVVNLGSFICEQTGQSPFTLTTDQFYMDWGGRMVGMGTNGVQIYSPDGHVETFIGPAGITSGTFTGNVLSSSGGNLNISALNANTHLYISVGNGGASTNVDFSSTGVTVSGTITSSGNVTIGSILSGTGISRLSNGGGTAGEKEYDSGFVSIKGYNSPSGIIETNVGVFGNGGLVIQGITNNVGPVWNGLANMLYMTNLTSVIWSSNGPVRIAVPRAYKRYWDVQTNAVDVLIN